MVTGSLTKLYMRSPCRRASRPLIALYPTRAGAARTLHGSASSRRSTGRPADAVAIAADAAGA